MAAGGGDHVFGQPICLLGVASEWEKDGEVRARLRKNGRLFISCKNPKEFEPVCHVEQAGFNSAVLKPLVERVRRYRAADGSFQLFTIAQVQAELLGNICA